MVHVAESTEWSESCRLMRSRVDQDHINPAGSESAVKGADSRKCTEPGDTRSVHASDLELLSDRSAL